MKSSPRVDAERFAYDVKCGVIGPEDWEMLSAALLVAESKRRLDDWPFVTKGPYPKDWFAEDEVRLANYRKALGVPPSTKRRIGG